MKKVNSGHEKSIEEAIDAADEAQTDIAEAWKVIADAAEVFNRAVAEVKPVILEKFAKYSEAHGDLTRLVEDVIGEMADYYDDKSDRWQKSDAGTAFAGWKEEWNDFLLVLGELCDPPTFPEISDLNEPELVDRDYVIFPRYRRND